MQSSPSPGGPGDGELLRSGHIRKCAQEQPQCLSDCSWLYICGTELLIHLRIKRNSQAVSQFLPGQVMILIRGADHTVQIEDDCVDVIHNANPFLVKTGSFPSLPAVMI